MEYSAQSEESFFVNNNNHHHHHQTTTTTTNSNNSTTNDNHNTDCKFHRQGSPVSVFEATNSTENQRRNEEETDNCSTTSCSDTSSLEGGALPADLSTPDLFVNIKMVVQQQHATHRHHHHHHHAAGGTAAAIRERTSSSMSGPLRERTSSTAGNSIGTTTTRERTNTAGSIGSIPDLEIQDLHHHHHHVLGSSPNRRVSFSTTATKQQQQTRKEVSTATRKAVEWLQSLKVPATLLKAVRKYRKQQQLLLTEHRPRALSANSSQELFLDLNNNNNNVTTTTNMSMLSSSGGSNNLKALVEHDTTDTVYLFTGLDIVFLTHSGDACADSVRIAGIKPPRYLFYMVSGFVCDIFQFIITVILHQWIFLDDSSMCWAFGFVSSIAARHTSHRYLVFGDYVGGYWKSLARMYGGYSVIIVLSTAFNRIVSQYLALNFYLVFVLTLLWTGIANYFILKKLWSFGGTTTTTSSSSNSNSNSNSTTSNTTKASPNNMTSE